MIAAESLTTPEEVMAYVQAKGSLAMQAYVAKVQRQLQQCIDDANQWERASHTAAEMRETDDALIVRKAKGTCPCGPDGCEWWAAASAFFERNPAIDADFLAAALRKVIKEGPSKTARVPLIVGPGTQASPRFWNPWTRCSATATLCTNPSSVHRVLLASWQSLVRGSSSSMIIARSSTPAGPRTIRP